MIQFDIDDIYLALMIFTRLTSLFMIMPVFSSDIIPMQCKVFIAGAFSVMLVPILTFSGTVPTHILGLVIALMGEVMVGVLMGFAGRMVFFAVEFATEIMAQESSLSSSSSFDPLRDEPSTTLAPLYTFLTTTIFFLLGMHLEMIGAVVRSFDFAPPGVGLFTLKSMEDITRTTSDVFVLGLKMSAPLIALAFVINFVFAVLGKIAPKFNVMILSFGVKILVSIFLLYASVELFATYVIMGFDGMALKMLEFVAQR
jgi:flagellar biosynthesis protein FliR